MNFGLNALEETAFRPRPQSLLPAWSPDRKRILEPLGRRWFLFFFAVHPPVFTTTEASPEVVTHRLDEFTSTFYDTRPIGYPDLMHSSLSWSSASYIENPWGTMLSSDTET
ncbi:hypothetical protein AAG570_010448 [Ranatra chinensis]|uniref:Uncharacterized protein n=1 Tax=Ranatra chinensis TaxID=642074 RepID=A0ABD0Z4N7_9HEMI